MTTVFAMRAMPERKHAITVRDPRSLADWRGCWSRIGGESAGSADAGTCARLSRPALRYTSKSRCTAIAKVISAFASAADLALGTQRQLELQGIAAWISVAVGALGALIGTQWGQAGVVGGVACGWIAQRIAAAAASWRYFFSRFEPAPA